MNKFAMTLTAIAALAIASPALADPAGESSAGQHCFFSNQFENWRAADSKTIYIRVGLKRFFRLDLVNECFELRDPTAFLVTKIHGSDMICSRLDWDLHVMHAWNDIPQACIVKSMTELTPDEVAALPPKDKP